jgi:putative hydrolase of HD superfamily
MNMMEFLKTVNCLKFLRRSGWVNRGVSNPESVADHAFMTILMCYVLGRKKGLDMEKLLKMAVVHDLAESVTGDIMTWTREGSLPEGNKTPEEKFSLEKAGLEKLLGNLNAGASKEVMDLWLEFEKAETPEAAFLKQTDKLEMLLQADIYQGSGNFKKSLKVFSGESRHIKDPELRKLLKYLHELKE